MADPTKVLDVLIKARDNILSPERWTRYAFAKNSEGLSVGWDAPSAVCFCSLGTIAKVATVQAHGISALDNAMYEGAKVALTSWLRDSGNPDHDVATYNDSTSHPEVIQMFDGAIAKLKEQIPC